MAKRGLNRASSQCVKSIPHTNTAEAELTQAGPSESTAPTQTSGRARRWTRRIARAIGLSLLAIVLFGMIAWAALAVYYSDLHEGAHPRRVTAAVLVLAAIAVIVFVRPRRYGVAILVAMFGAT